MSRSAIPKKTVALVLERDGGFCLLRIGDTCLVSASVADHRANRGSGGAGQRLNKPSNLVAACAVCNGLKEDAHGDVLDGLVRRGLRVRSDSTHGKTALRALMTPVVYPDGRTFFLDDDGGRQLV